MRVKTHDRIIQSLHMALMKRSILTWWRTGRAFDSRPQGCGFDSLSRKTFCFLYLCARAFSASLKRSLNLSANKHYYYYGLKGIESSWGPGTVQQAWQELPLPPEIGKLQPDGLVRYVWKHGSKVLLWRWRVRARTMDHGLHFDFNRAVEKLHSSPCGSPPVIIISVHHARA